MDKKQTKIFNDILDKFKLPHKKIKFMQHRNLTEFKYFNIERINPTHRIILYGSLKNNNKKKETSKQLLKVGEILIGFITIGFNLSMIVKYLDIISLIGCIYLIDVLFFVMFGNMKLRSMIFYDYLNRGFSWRRENRIHG